MIWLLRTSDKRISSQLLVARVGQVQAVQAVVEQVQHGLLEDHRRPTHYTFRNHKAAPNVFRVFHLLIVGSSIHADQQLVLGNGLARFFIHD